MEILERICRQVRSRVAAREGVVPIEVLEERAGEAGPLRPFRGALARAGEVSLIAELKKASPSKGLIRADFDVPALARACQRGGARALSVLTEPDFFQGSLNYLEAARNATDLPILAKDFFLTAYQVYEARSHGADAVLLIAAALSDDEERKFRRLAAKLGMAALVEVHNQAELERALAGGADIIGINNRNLHTFEVDLAVTEALAPEVPVGVLTVAESGIVTPQDVARLAAAGVDAMLVGESLMRSADVGEATWRLVEAGCERPCLPRDRDDPN